MSKELNQLYNRILNLKGENIEDNINFIISEIKKEIDSYNLDYSGLCKLISNNLSIKLNEKGIHNKIINLKTLFDAYEHEFVICFYYFNGDHFLLIDPTYSQFVNNKNQQLRENILNNWPGDILNSTQEGQKILNDLLQKGYIELTEENLRLYLNSFGISSLISIEDLMEEKNYFKK